MRMANPNRPAVNITLPKKIVGISKSWADQNGTDMSNLVERLLRDHFEEMGIPCDLTVEEFVSQVTPDSEPDPTGPPKQDLKTAAGLKKSGLEKIKKAVSKKE